MSVIPQLKSKKNHEGSESGLFHCIPVDAGRTRWFREDPMHWRRKWQPTPVFLPGESQGRGSLVGCHIWGRTESDGLSSSSSSSSIQQHVRAWMSVPYPHGSQGVSLVAQTVKNLPVIRETWVWSLGREDPLKKGMATHSSIFAWRIPWVEEPGSLQSMGHKESDTTEWLTLAQFSNLINVKTSFRREEMLVIFIVLIFYYVT